MRQSGQLYNSLYSGRPGGRLYWRASRGGATRRRLSWRRGFRPADWSREGGLTFAFLSEVKMLSSELCVAALVPFGELSQMSLRVLISGL